MGRIVLKDFLLSSILVGLLYLILHYLYDSIDGIEYILAFSFLIIFGFSSALSMFIFKLKSKIEFLNSQIEKLNKFDEVTGTYKRGYFFDLLKRYIDIAKKKSLKLSLLIIDIDNFKEISQKYGYEKGDEVIKKISNILKKRLNDMDVIARFGAGEFVIMSFKDKKEMKNLAEELIEAIKKECEIEMNISAGVSEFDIFDNENSLIKKANEALILAKYKGGNRVDFVEHFLLFE